MVQMTHEQRFSVPCERSAQVGTVWPLMARRTHKQRSPVPCERSVQFGTVQSFVQQMMCEWHLFASNERVVLTWHSLAIHCSPVRLGLRFGRQGCRLAQGRRAWPGRSPSPLVAAWTGECFSKRKSHTKSVNIRK